MSRTPEEITTKEEFVEFVAQELSCERDDTELSLSWFLDKGILQLLYLYFEVNFENLQKALEQHALEVNPPVEKPEPSTKRSNFENKKEKKLPKQKIIKQKKRRQFSEEKEEVGFSGNGNTLTWREMAEMCGRNEKDLRRVLGGEYKFVTQFTLEQRNAVMEKLKNSGI